jgi:hypothetical protein
MNKKIDVKHNPIHEGVKKLMKWLPTMDILACKHPRSDVFLISLVDDGFH